MINQLLLQKKMEGQICSFCKIATKRLWPGHFDYNLSQQIIFFFFQQCNGLFSDSGSCCESFDANDGFVVGGVVNFLFLVVNTLVI